LGLVIGFAAVVFVAVLGFRFWYEPTYNYTEVDDAQVTGNLARVPAPASGQVAELSVQVGDHVMLNDKVASIKAAIPGVGGAPPHTVLTRVSTPLDGLVAALWVGVGDNIGAGQPVVTIVNLNQLWIIANVDEARVAQIETGQTVEVTVNGLGQTFQGMVTGIGSATTEAINPPPSGSLSSSDTTKKVPVRIDVDWTGAQPLPMPGMTADVIIHIQ
jgi:multidrug resistance efflux pump